MCVDAVARPIKTPQTHVRHARVLLHSGRQACTHTYPQTFSSTHKCTRAQHAYSYEDTQKRVWTCACTGGAFRTVGSVYVQSMQMSGTYISWGWIYTRRWQIRSFPRRCCMYRILMASWASRGILCTTMRPGYPLQTMFGSFIPKFLARYTAVSRDFSHMTCGLRRAWACVCGGEGVHAGFL